MTGILMLRCRIKIIWWEQDFDKIDGGMGDEKWKIIPYRCYA